MQNLMVTDISVHKTNIYQNEVFFICESVFYTKSEISEFRYIVISEINQGNVTIMLTHHLFISCF